LFDKGGFNALLKHLVLSVHEFRLELISLHNSNFGLPFRPGLKFFEKESAKKFFNLSEKFSTIIDYQKALIKTGVLSSALNMLLAEELTSLYEQYANLRGATQNPRNTFRILRNRWLAVYSHLNQLTTILYFLCRSVVPSFFLPPPGADKIVAWILIELN